MDCRNRSISCGGVSSNTALVTEALRDKTLALPAQMLSAIQINIRAGALPPPESNGQRYLKIPVDRF